MTGATNKIYELYSKCYNLKHVIWEEDIPSATIPEYVQIHKVCCLLTNFINEHILVHFEQFCANKNSSYCSRYCVEYMSFTPIGDISYTQYKAVFNQIMLELNNLRVMIINKDIVPHNAETREHHEKCLRFLHYIEENFNFSDNK